jgi:hypothetical protein
LDTRIYKIDIQFWAVWGSQGFREKNANCHKLSKYATFEGSVFMPSGSKKLFIFFRYCSIRTKKLHSMKHEGEKKLKSF